MAALELIPAEQSGASAGKATGLSRQGVASCHHHDTYIYYNQRPPSRLGLEAGLGDCSGNLLPMKFDRLPPHRCSSSFFPMQCDSEGQESKGRLPRFDSQLFPRTM